MRSYSVLLNDKTREYGAKFDASALAQQFAPYFTSGERVRVRFALGEEMTGTIGVTTGWRPCFLLMRTSRSVGSPWTLGSGDTVIAVKHKRGYVQLTSKCTACGATKQRGQSCSCFDNNCQ